MIMNQKFKFSPSLEELSVFVEHNILEYEGSIETVSENSCISLKENNTIARDKKSYIEIFDVTLVYGENKEISSKITAIKGLIKSINDTFKINEINLNESGLKEDIDYGLIIVDASIASIIRHKNLIKIYDEFYYKNHPGVKSDTWKSICSNLNLES